MDMNGYLAEAKLAVVHVQKKTPLGTYNQIRDTTRQPLMLPFRIMMRGAQILRENQEVAKLTPEADARCELRAEDRDPRGGGQARHERELQRDGGDRLPVLE